MTYRSQEDAALDREFALEKELLELKARQREQARHDAEVLRVTTELRKHRDVLDRVAKGRTLPMLDSLRIAAPCSARWEDMVGDDRSRHCGHCDQHVFNLSAMTREEAELTMLEKTGDVCVRLFQRADGTVLTTDCPVGARRRRLRLVGAVAIGGGLMAAGLAALSHFEGHDRPVQTMGLALRMDPAAAAPLLEPLLEGHQAPKK